MARTQRGITLMGFLMVLVVVGFFALIAIKLFPMYSEFYNMRGAVNDLAAQPNSANMTPTQVYEDLDRRFGIAYVSSVKREHIKLVRAGRGVQLTVAYEVRQPMLGNLDIVGSFEHTVQLGKAPGG